MSTQSGAMALSEVCDEFMINRGIDKKKYFPRYMVIAKRSWQKLFWNTIWSTYSSWQTVQVGTPYNYVNVPKGTTRIFTASIQDHHGRIQPLFYNGQLNIIPQPTYPTCGCTQCQCDGLCDAIGSTTLTTKLLFTINGVNYYEKTWIKSCPNGDIIQWSEIPTKKYNDFIGQSGDYNADYNNDFSTGNPSLSNFDIVTQTFQKKLCSLEVRPCGCPLPTPQNIQLINTFCGCFFPGGFWTWKHEHKPTFLDDINPNYYGEVKLSECGTKLYFRPTRHWETLNPTNPLIPTYLLINGQTNGLDCTDEVLVPEYALDAMWDSMFYRSIKLKSNYSLSEKTDAKYQMNDSINGIIMFLNPLNLQEIANVQNGPILW